MAKVLEERGFVSVRPEQITKLVKDTGALRRASELARDYVSRAKVALEELPDTEYRRALLAVPDFILDRKNCGPPGLCSFVAQGPTFPPGNSNSVRCGNRALQVHALALLWLVCWAACAASATRSAGFQSLSSYHL